MKIIFYPSSHGFGHTTRLIALASEFIKWNIHCIFRTDRPRFLFNSLSNEFFEYSNASFDFGIKQDTWLFPNFDETKNSLEDLLNSKNIIIENELEYLKEEKPDFIIADIPPLVFEIANKAEIPIVGISNFDWHYIYKNMFGADFVPLAELKSMYEKANFAYQLPFSDNESMNVFPRLKKTGLLARLAYQSRDNICENFSFAKNDKIVLLSFGGGNENPINLEQLLSVKNIKVLSRYPGPIHKNYIQIDENISYESLLSVADVIITKAGYSTLAESVQHKPYIIFTDRVGFPEDKILREGLKDYKHFLYIKSSELLNTNWNKVFAEIPNSQPNSFDNKNYQIASTIIKDIVNTKNIYTIIDVGTNNILLLTVRLVDSGYDVIHRASYTSFLGKNMEDGYLAEDAIMRVKDILTDCINFGRTMNSQFIISGTSCSRDAININVISDWLKINYNIDYKILSSDEEATYNGVANISEFLDYDKILFFDIGGGSTEFTFVENNKIMWVQSIKLGLRRLCNKTNDFDKQLKIIRKRLLEVDNSLPKDILLVGIGGTACSIAAIEQKFLRYNGDFIHKSCILRKSVDQLCDNFCQLNANEIVKLVPFDPLRAGIITTGILATREILKYFSAEEFYVSDRGLQFGILEELRKDFIE